MEYNRNDRNALEENVELFGLNNITIIDHIDDETNHRVRCIANGKWTEEDEAWYLALDAEVTAYIEEHFPYPEESGS